MKNDVSTGQRIEVMEGKNLEFKEQMAKDTAFIYRRGLVKEDLFKDTFTVSISNAIELSGSERELSGGQPQPLSMSTLVADLITYQAQKLTPEGNSFHNTLDQSKEDKFE